MRNEAIHRVGHLLRRMARRFAGTALVALTMMLVIVPTAAAWSVGGGALNRSVAGDGSGRAVSLGFAAAIAASVALVWL